MTSRLRIFILMQYVEHAFQGHKVSVFCCQAKQSLRRLPDGQQLFEYLDQPFRFEGSSRPLSLLRAASSGAFWRTSAKKKGLKCSRTLLEVGTATCTAADCSFDYRGSEFLNLQLSAELLLRGCYFQHCEDKVMRSLSAVPD